MLSATVPNTLEFADWVGNTKKTKVRLHCKKKATVKVLGEFLAEFRRNVSFALFVMTRL